MSFLYPLALAIGALAGIPIVIHLLRRHTDRRVPFPALRYLQRAERKHARSLRVRDLLLLLVRVGLLLLIAATAAGPLVGRGGASDHEPVDVAIVLDNSASNARPVGNQTTFDLLRDRVRSTLAAAGPADRFWLYPTVGPPLALATTAAEAGRALEQARLTDGSADLVDAVTAAARSLPAERRREVHLLSDLQASNFASLPDAGQADEIALLVFTGLSLDASNGMVGMAQLASGLNIPVGTQSDVVASALWFPGPSGRAAPADSTVLRLEIDGTTRGAAAVGWGDEAVFRIPSLDPATHGGRFEIEPSGLRADDARYFSFRVVNPPAAAWTGPPGSFTGIALATLQAGGRVADGEGGVRIYEAGEGQPAEPTGSGYLTVVLVPPADPLSLPRFNQLLTRIGIPWTLFPDDTRGELALRDPSGVPGLDEIRIESRYLMTPGGGVEDSVLLATGDGEPWLIRGRANGHTYLLLASPLVESAGSLAGSAAMIPFIETVILRWGLDAGWPASDFEAGLSMTLPTGSDSVVTPGQGTVRVDGGAPFTPLRAGLYGLHYEEEGQPRSLTFAANVPATESDLTPLATRDLAELFSGREVVTAGPEASAWESVIYRNRRGRDVRPWLVVAIILLALAEIALASPAPLKESAKPTREI